MELDTTAVYMPKLLLPTTHTSQQVYDATVNLLRNLQCGITQCCVVTPRAPPYAARLPPHVHIFTAASSIANVTVPWEWANMTANNRTEICLNQSEFINTTLYSEFARVKSRIIARLDSGAKGKA